MHCFKSTPHNLVRIVGRFTQILKINQYVIEQKLIFIRYQLIEFEMQKAQIMSEVVM